MDDIRRPLDRMLDQACAAMLKEAEARDGIANKLQPIETAPLDGAWILLAGPSGYITTPLRVEVCRYVPKFRPLAPWQNHANNAFTDGGVGPTHWMPLPKAQV